MPRRQQTVAQARAEQAREAQADRDRHDAAKERDLRARAWVHWGQGSARLALAEGDTSSASFFASKLAAPHRELTAELARIRDDSRLTAEGKRDAVAAVAKRIRARFDDSGDPLHVVRRKIEQHAAQAKDATAALQSLVRQRALGVRRENFYDSARAIADSEAFARLAAKEQVARIADAEASGDVRTLLAAAEASAWSGVVEECRERTMRTLTSLVAGEEAREVETLSAQATIAEQQLAAALGGLELLAAAPRLGLGKGRDGDDVLADASLVSAGYLLKADAEGVSPDLLDPTPLTSERRPQTAEDRLQEHYERQVERQVGPAVGADAP